MAPQTKTRTLSTADERRETLIEAALPVFGRRGFHAASTVEIAEAAGISQAYVFRLFPTKVDLFVAAAAEGSRRMLATFRAASDDARSSGTDQLEAMGRAYTGLVERDRDVLLMQLQSQVASPGEPKIREQMQSCFREIYELVAGRSGAGAEEMRAWFAHGMLCNVMAAIEAENLKDEWARALTAGD
ncbi:MAG: TetR/AcrR family transcriptional regulator [Thermoleophilaceae bacterium]|nr:TetR/AcrR family transcriptional regulator [Thermoleophilaceae bacterium]